MKDLIVVMEMLEKMGYNIESLTLDESVAIKVEITNLLFRLKIEKQ